MTGTRRLVRTVALLVAALMFILAAVLSGSDRIDVLGIGLALVAVALLVDTIGDLAFSAVQLDARLLAKAVALGVAVLLFIIGAFDHGTDTWLTLFSLGLLAVTIALVLDEAIGLYRQLAGTSRSTSPPPSSPNP